MVPYGEPDIREPGTDVSIAALCEVGESVFIHYTTYPKQWQIDFLEYPSSYRDVQYTNAARITVSQ